MANEPLYGALGMSEQESRRTLEQELELAIGTERELSAHAIAHSVARVVQLDHLRMAEQLQRAGMPLPAAANDERST